MKLNEKKLKEMIVGELKEASSLAKWSDSKKSQRWKVYIDGEKKPLILTGRSASEVKKFAHQMIQNSSVKIKKVVKEGKLTEGPAGDYEQAHQKVKKAYHQFNDAYIDFSRLLIKKGLKPYGRQLDKVYGGVEKLWKFYNNLLDKLQ